MITGKDYMLKKQLSKPRKYGKRQYQQSSKARIDALIRQRNTLAKTKPMSTKIDAIDKAIMTERMKSSTFTSPFKELGFNELKPETWILDPENGFSHKDEWAKLTGYDKLDKQSKKLDNQAKKIENSNAKHFINWEMPDGTSLVVPKSAVKNLDAKALATMHRNSNMNKLLAPAMVVSAFMLTQGKSNNTNAYWDGVVKAINALQNGEEH